MSRRSNRESHSTSGPSWLLRIWNKILWPFRIVWTILQSILRPKWLIRISNSIARKFFLFETPSWVKNLSGVVNPPKQEVSKAHLLNPLYWIAWTIELGWRLFISRPYRNLGPAIPAIVCLLAIGSIVWMVKIKGRQSQAAAYRQHLYIASQDHNYDRAIIVVGRLIDLFPDNLDYRFQRALIDEKRDNTEESTNQLNRLAFLEEHVKSAQYLLLEKTKLSELPNWGPEQHLRFRKLIELSKRSNVEKQQAIRVLSATYYNAIGARQEAIRQISDIATESPELSMMLAILYNAEGETTSARISAEIAEKGLRKRLLANASDREARVGLAKMLVLLAQERSAAKILMDGFQLTKEDVLREGAAEALISLSNRLAKSPGDASLIERLQVIRGAMDIAPESAIVMDAIVNLVFEVRENKNEEITTLGKALVGGLSSDSVHFIRGTLALLQDDIDAAKVHLEQAAKANSNLPGVLNNLAIAVSSKDDGDLTYALKLAEAAINQLPEHPFVRETRGRILLKLKRYSDAIPDLEFALRAPELAQQVHGSLAEAYSALGQKDIAAEHEKLSQKSSL